jgi:hypothetical protein
MPNAPDSDKTRRVTRRIVGAGGPAKPRLIKDLLSKAGLNEKQVTQAAESQEYWTLKVREIVGSDWAAYISRTQFERGELTVWVDSVARATRVRLLLGSALVDGRLVIAARGEMPRRVQVRASR